MYSYFYLSKLSFKSIFKILLIPTLFFSVIFSIYDVQNNIFIEKFNQTKQEIDSNDPLYKKFSNNQLASKHSTKLIIISSIGLNFFCSIWVWFCLRIYFLFFRLKIKAGLAPMVHDQKDALADEPPQGPDKI